jgi:hypothetical protein
MRPTAEEKYGQRAWVKLVERTTLALDRHALALSRSFLNPAG